MGSLLDCGNFADGSFAALIISKVLKLPLHCNRESPIAIHQEEANEQHYEVPAEFYKLCLGPLLKYSSCYFKVTA